VGGGGGGYRQAVDGAAVQGDMQKVTLTRWRGDVFSVDDGVTPVVPRDPKTDVEFRAFLEAVMKNEIPPGYTRETHLVFEDKADQDFAPPPMKMFSGAGRRLGDVVPAVQGAGAAAEPAVAVAPTAAAPVNPVDESLPTTRMQIRLADGTRLVSRFNPTQTVADLRHFVTLAQPAALKGREFVLMTTFPNRVIEDESLSLEDAKLCNAAVVQKWK
jgi:UBX domain-containing protein 1